MRLVAIDTETAGLHGAIHRVGFLNERGQYVYGGREKFPALRREIARTQRIIMFNAKYDMEILTGAGVRIPWEKVDDPIIMATLVTNSQQKSLLRLALDHLDYDGAEDLALEDYKTEHKIKEDYSQIPDDVLRPYNHRQLINTICLFALWRDHLPADAYRMEMDLIPVLLDMERRGVRVSSRRLKEARMHLNRERSQLSEDIAKEAGADFDPGSPKQVGEYLTERGVELPRTAKGRAATGEAILMKRGGKFGALILRHRRLGKLIGTYVDGLLDDVREDGAIHASFAQTVTRTGRLSSSNPNMQNIDKERVIRRTFLVRRGFENLAADYNQIELRLAFFFAGDSAGVRSIMAGEDLHQATANLFGVERFKGKTVNFAILYGEGGPALGAQLGINVQGAWDFIDGFFRAHPEVEVHRNRVMWEAKKKGVVRLPSGRELHIEPTEYFKSYNYLIQGGAAEVIKKAMVECRRLLLPTKSAMLLQIHDELVFELKAGERKRLLPRLVKAMVDACHYPMRVDVTRWEGDWSQEEVVV